MKPHDPQPSAEPKPLDPAHEINARSIVTWVVAWSGILFVGLWLMLVVFERVMQDERVDKIESQPNTELNDTKKDETLYLSGQWEANFPRKTIEQVMQEMVHK
jgi:hypothetical protein